MKGFIELIFNFFELKGYFFDVKTNYNFFELDFLLFLKLQVYCKQIITNYTINTILA